jgi:hypothetical protein
MNYIVKLADRFLKLANKSELYRQIDALKPQLAAAAQEVYDAWDASDEENGDWQVGTGGICHLIADKMLDVLTSNISGLTATTISSTHEVHVYVVAGKTNVDEDGEKEEEYYGIDIRPYNYETGGGYSWKKIPDVLFTPDMVQVDWVEPLELDENGDITEIY